MSVVEMKSESLDLELYLMSVDATIKICSYDKEQIVIPGHAMARTKTNC